MYICIGFWKWKFEGGFLVGSLSICILLMFCFCIFIIFKNNVFMCFFVFVEVYVLVFDVYGIFFDVSSIDQVLQVEFGLQVF